MHFGFSQEISGDIRADIITVISQNANQFFHDRDYGLGLVKLVIGIVCVAPEFDFFFKVRKKSNKLTKLVEYDIKLDHAIMKNADNKKFYEVFQDRVIESLDILDELKIKEFDVNQFRSDLKIFFKENAKLGEVEKFYL